MDLAIYLRDRARAKALAKAVGTSTDYLYQIATGRRNASVGNGSLCERIEAATKGLVSRYDLRPDVYGVAPSDPMAA